MLGPEYHGERKREGSGSSHTEKGGRGRGIRTNGFRTKTLVAGRTMNDIRADDQKQNRNRKVSGDMGTSGHRGGKRGGEDLV